MSSLTDGEYEMIQSRANTLVLYWIDNSIEYTTILNELTTLSSYYIVLNIHIEALDLFMYYLYSCDSYTRTQFGIDDTSIEHLDSVMNRISTEIDMLRSRMDKNVCIM